MSRADFASVRSASVLLALAAALAGCADEPSPTEPHLRPQFAMGDVFTVTNTNNDGPGSLRQALADATSDATIQFEPSLAGATIALQGALEFAAPLTIEGPESGGITLDAGGLARVMEISVTTAGSTATLRNLTITGGNGFSGAGIRSDAKLLVEHTTITGNVASSFGGGILALDDITLVNSTVSGNTSGASGGGIFRDPGNVVLINSTVAYNEAAQAGGGVEAQFLTLRNSVIAHNVGDPENCFTPVPPTLVGRNISTDDSCGAAGPAMLIVDPAIDALASNGGPSQTHALLIGSPAIDAALSCNVTVDQRYVVRPQGSACDIGAHEFDAYTSITIVVDGSASVNPTNGVAVMSGSIRCSNDESFDLEVGLEQTQKAGRVTTSVKAAHTQSIACGTAVQYWSAALAPASGSFRNGIASAEIATTNTDIWVTPASVAQPVKLFWGHK